jgi:nucleotide-binding universal stress UspA family protein
MSEMTYSERLVAGYDGSQESAVGLDWAVDAAARTGVPLRVVVVEDSPELVAGAGRPTPASEVVAQAEKKLATAHLGDAAVESIVGRTAGTLREYVTAADLLVVGSRGHGAVAGALIGSVSHDLSRHAPCPVVVARPVAAPAVNQVTVGLDGSPQSLRALGWAVRHAKAFRGEVVALHGFRPGEAGGPFGADVPEELTRRLDRAERQLTEWVDTAPVDHTSGIKTEAIAVPPKKLLVDVSEHSSVVVVGARSRDVGMLLGSVADHVLAHAHCPVVVVQ